MRTLILFLLSFSAVAGIQVDSDAITVTDLKVTKATLDDEPLRVHRINNRRAVLTCRHEGCLSEGVHTLQLNHLEPARIEVPNQSPNPADPLPPNQSPSAAIPPPPNQSPVAAPAPF